MKKSGIGGPKKGLPGTSLDTVEALLEGNVSEDSSNGVRAGVAPLVTTSLMADDGGIEAAAAPAATDGWAGSKWAEKPGNGSPASGTPADSGVPGKPDGVGNADQGNGGVGNPDPGGNNPGNGNSGNGGNGNPDPGGNNPGNGNSGNGGNGNPDPGGNNPGNGNGGNGGNGNPNPGGGGSDKPGAPTPPDELLQDIDTATYVSSVYRFNIDDISGGFDGSTVATNSDIIDYNTTKVTKEGVTLYAIDSEFGFYVTDFVGAQDKVFDGDHAEGWAGNLIGPAGEVLGLTVSDAPTDTLLTPAKLGTWLQGIGGNSVKASTEHYTVMQAVLSDQAYPGDTSGLYQLDDDLRIIDYKVLENGMPDLDGAGQLQEDVMHKFYVDEMVQALEAAGSTDPLPVLDFDRDGVADTYNASMANVEIDGVIRNVAAVDIGNDGSIDYYDGELNGFGVFGLADIIKPNESTILEEIAYGDDYSVTVKDDGKLLYRWGNMIKRPNDIRVDAKIELPDEWSEQDVDGLNKLFLVTAAELVVNHTVTNNPNDQIRPEDFENEAAIGQLPSYIAVRDPFDTDGSDGYNELWVAPADMYAGDGTFLPSYFRLTDTGEIDLTPGGTPVYGTDGAKLVGYLNEDAFGNAAGTVLRDYSMIDLAEGSTLADIGALSSDLIGGFTEAWYTTMDREPFQADLNDAGTEYDIGPRWRLQPDKYGQDLPSVTIPIDPSDAPPVQNGEEKYEVGADTSTVINLLDWAGTSPLTLSAGWQTGAGTVSGNGLNMTEDFDIAFYIKGDIKPVNLYDAQLVMSYEEVETFAKGVAVVGTSSADVLVGQGGNDFFLGAGDGEEDLIVFGYGATTASEIGANTVDGFAVDEDALGLIGFDLNPDNFDVHITQEVDEGDLLIRLDGVEIATLNGVIDYLGSDDFYLA